MAEGGNAGGRTFPTNSNLRALVIEMCKKHELSGECGPDCICQELLNELDKDRKKNWKNWHRAVRGA